MNNYELAIFDVDGTLLDTSKGVISSLKYVIEQYGLDMPQDETLAAFIGPPVQETFRSRFGLSGNAPDEAADLFRTHYKEKDLFKAEPYDGIFELLEKLKANDVKIAAATYKREDYALDILAHFGFDSYSNIMYGSDLNGKLKKSDIIMKCVNESGISPNSAVMIGDTSNDRIGAELAGIDFIAVTYGFGYKKGVSDHELKGVKVAHSPRDLGDYIICGGDRNEGC